MIGYRFIPIKQLVATCMVGLGKNKITYSELNVWAEYLKKSLSTESYKTITIFGQKNIDELRITDNGFLFRVGEYSIKLADGKTKKDLDEHILSYTDTDVLEATFRAPKDYKKNAKEELTT